jgi:hypothetical protein
VSVVNEFPQDLYDAMRTFVETHPQWDQYRLMQVALAGFLFQPGGGSPEVMPRDFSTDASPGMLVFAADRFGDVEAVIAAVRGGRTVVLNVAGLPAATAQRLVDFVCGGITAMDGQVQRLGEEVFLLAPALAQVEVDSPAADASASVRR